MPADYALTTRCPACHGVAELAGMTGTALVYECACGERVEEGSRKRAPIVIGWITFPDGLAARRREVG